MAEESAALKPTDAVRRILAASGAVIPDKEAYWLGFHMERFVKHIRKAGELLDLTQCIPCIPWLKSGI